jgi:hypothetical protein
MRRQFSETARDNISERLVILAVTCLDATNALQRRYFERVCAPVLYIRRAMKELSFPDFGLDASPCKQHIRYCESAFESVSYQVYKPCNVPGLRYTRQLQLRTRQDWTEEHELEDQEEQDESASD